MGVILTMTMVMMTGLAITRERERGTMENLLATPVRPLEVMTGKIVPYVLIGLIQVSIIVAAARFVFDVPFVGGVFAIYLSALLFIAANPDGRHHAVVARAEPVAGDAARGVLFPAEHPAVGLHVPVRRDAEVGAVRRQPAAAHLPTASCAASC